MFKLITYEIAKELQSTRMGFQNSHLYIPILLFADDGLMLSQTEREMEEMLHVLTRISEKMWPKNK